MDKVFGKYRIAAPIIIGSPNAAYHARSITGSEWDAVVKVYATRPVSSPEERETFFQYMAVLSQLKHPHILPITDYGIENKLPFCVTEYMTYGSLRERLERRSSAQLSLQEMITIIAQIGRALQCAHDQHTIHGNIKPENILFNKNNDVLLTDFSLPEMIGGNAYSGPNTAQSSYYQAFEVLSEKSDQYALGYLADELFGELTPTASLALVSPPEQYALEEAALHPAFEVSKQVWATLSKAMNREPDERYKDIAAFVDALNEVYTTQSMATLSSSSVPPAALAASNISHNAKTLKITKVPQEHPILSRLKQYPQSKSGSARGPLLIAIVLLLFGILSVGLIWQFSLAQLLQKNASAIVPQASPGTVTIVTPTGLSQLEPTLVVTPTVPATVGSSTSTPKMHLSPTAKVPISTPPTPTVASPVNTPVVENFTPTPVVVTSPTPIVSTPAPILTLSCHVNYGVTDQWSTGFLANLTISNTSTIPINSWQLQWSFASNQRITNVWNANILQSGQNVTMSNISWDGNIPPGSTTTSIGFSASTNSPMNAPHNFILNGTACN